MADEGITITLDGEEFAVEDFEGRELVDAERAFGISLFAELERGSVTGIYAMLYLIKKRSNPRFTADDAMALSLGDVTKMLATPENGTAGGPPSDRAGGRRAKKSPAATAGNQPS